MSIFAINLKIGPEGLLAMFFVLGEIPRPARKTPLKTQMVRSEMIESAKAEIPKIHAKMRLAFGLWHPSGAKDIEQS